jgi:hypothetical protein
LGDRSDPRLFVAQRKQKAKFGSRSSPYTTQFTNFTLLWRCAGTRLLAPSSRSSVFFLYMNPKFFLFYTVGTPRGACWTSFESRTQNNWSFLMPLVDLCWFILIRRKQKKSLTRICHATQHNTTQQFRLLQLHQRSSLRSNS